MTNFSATVSVSAMEQANTTLQGQGYGPNNFSVPVYGGPSPTYAVLHCWNNPLFEAAVTAVAGVVKQQGLASPGATVEQLCNTVGADWGASAPLLTGNVTPGLYRDTSQVLWWVIQAYNTATYPNPALIPALVRMAKVPGTVIPWVQPIDQYDAYKLINSFTGKPDECTHNGSKWRVSQADGAGNNIWEPGVFGWVTVA
jgi:hypothetical protein